MRQADSAFQSVGADTKPVETGSPSTSSWCCMTTAARRVLRYALRFYEINRFVESVPNVRYRMFQIFVRYFRDIFPYTIYFFFIFILYENANCDYILHYKIKTFFLIRYEYIYQILLF